MGQRLKTRITGWPWDQKILRASLAIVCFALIVSTGCAHRPPTSAPNPGLKSTLTFISTPTSLQNCAMRLTVVDKSGRAAALNAVVLRMTMTTMFMPPNVVTLSQTKPGEYIGTGIFTMTGAWSLDATGKLNGTTVNLGAFPVEVKQ